MRELNRWQGIVIYPDLILKTICEPVAEFNLELQATIMGMKSKLAAHNGLGLAAPQVGISKRFFLMKRFEENQIVVVCNPVLKLEGQSEAGIEGCLSLPGVRNQVFRNTNCIMLYQDVNGEMHEVKLEALEARIAQHECDHLNGVLFIDRLSRQMRRATLRDYQKIIGRGL